jgi:hypothetical protein
MAYKVLVTGNTSTGKSSAIAGLPPEETFVIQCTKKDLPFAGSRLMYVDKDNKYQTSKPNEIIAILKKKNLDQKTKYIIIDDANYVMFYELKRKRDEKGYEKFNALGFDFTDILLEIDNMRDDIVVFFIGHLETNDFGKETFKTAGKMVRDQLIVEGLFDIVLIARGFENDYKFSTKEDSIAKTAIGMFESRHVDNNFLEISNTIKKYYGETPNQTKEDKKEKATTANELKK